MDIKKSFLCLSILINKRQLMTKQERIISERIALYDKNLQLIINKSDYTKSLLLQSIFDRQIQEYIHLNCQIPIDKYDRFLYRLNSLIIHNPSYFDKYPSLVDKYRFRSKMEY